MAEKHRNTVIFIKRVGRVKLTILGKYSGNAMGDYTLTHGRRPAMGDHQQVIRIGFFIKSICYRKPTVLKDHFSCALGEVSHDRLCCICIYVQFMSNLFCIYFSLSKYSCLKYQNV